jgi:O-antigen/teichoic acid export membrane protein
MNQGDVLLLNMFSSTAAVGVYTVSKKLAYSILTITDPLTTSSYPQLAHLSAQRKYNDLLVMLKKITKALIIPIIIFLFLAYIFRNDVTTKIYGSEYIHAGNPFFIHLLGAAQGALFFWSLPLIQSMGLTRIRIYGYIIALISQAIITFLLAPKIGASGAAIGLLVGNLITTLIFLYFSFQRIKNNIVADIN